MRIVYLDRELKEMCRDERKAKKELGAHGFKKLRRRLADLEAAQSVDELVAGRPHALQGDRKGQFAVDLDGGRRLVFKPLDEGSLRREDGSIDWSQVTSICIIFIGDYHD